MAKRSYLTGMKECRGALQELSRGVQRNVGKRSLKAPADVLAAAIRSRAPVREGNLRNSIKVVPAKTSKGRPRIAVLVDDISAVPNEFGTSKMAAQPFARPAVDAARERAASAMAEALKSEVGAATARAAKASARRAARK